MHVLYYCPVFDPAAGSAEELLRRYFPVGEWCRALRSAGVERVTVVMRFHRPAKLELDGVDYVVVRDRLAPHPPVWAVPSRLGAAAVAAAADVVHVNGMIFPVQVRALRRTLAASTAIVVQNHAERPPRGPRRRLARWGLSAADGALFSAAALADAWRCAGAFPPALRAFEVMECPPHLPPAAGHDFRRFPGSPRFLWLANLDTNKDPLTVLQGFAKVAAEFPDACLLMAYRGDGLLGPVRDALCEPALAGRVHLLGRIPRDALRDFFAAGDFLVQGSHREGSSLAVIEALACGVHPIVTDIPSMRTIIGDGAAGTHWRAADADDLARAIREAVARRQPREEVRAFFASHWSHEAIGKAAVQAYEEAIRLRRGGGVG
jgi:glycosyltransferase involved in cell wall biosynthesis